MTIQISAPSDHSEEEIRSFIDNYLLQRADVRFMISTTQWVGSVLHVTSPFGNGTMTIAKGSLDIKMDLTPFGMAVRSRIEEGLGKAARKLQEGSWK